MRNPVTTPHMSWRGKITEGIHPIETGVKFSYNYNTGQITQSVSDNSPLWQHVGVSPRPRTRWEWFWWDYHHGMIMRYPRLAVIRFAVRQWLNWNHPSSRPRHLT